MEIDILYVPECPNLPRTQARLREALELSGITASLRTIEVSTQEAAADAGMRGSPTILIDGRDPFGRGDEKASVSCRLYTTLDDGLDGAPTTTQLIEALSRRA